jgi:hypothetical protein
MNRRMALVSTLVVMSATLPVWSGQATARPVDTEVGIPAQVVDFTPDSNAVKSYRTTDYTLADDPTVGVRQGTTNWRVVSGTGNAAELWFTISKQGRLFDLGGRYINYTDDEGATWKSVRPLDPLVNAEGSVAVAPNGDVLGVTWDPYSGDRVITYKYSAAEGKWYYNYNPVHTPFWDRPGLDIIPGPITTPLGTFPYMSFINGLPHDPWFYSTDGLNYYNASSMLGDTSTGAAPITSYLDPVADPSFDWNQPNVSVFPFAALGGGRAVNGPGGEVGGQYLFTASDMKWHDFTMPDGNVDQPIQIDSLGRVHQIINAPGGFEYRISTDGGRTWNGLVIKGATLGNGGFASDFHANASLGIAAVWALHGKQDLVYKIDISGDQPKLMRKYVVGLGDDSRDGGVGFYGASGGHRFDFSSIGIFPDGRIAVSFMDSTTTMPFPTLTLPVVAPALAIEQDTTLPPAG